MVAERVGDGGLAPRGQSGSVLAFEQLKTSLELARLLNAISAVPSVSRIAYTADDPPYPRMHLWVMMPTEAIEDELTIYSIDRAFRTQHPEMPLEVEIVVLDRVDSTRLPPYQVVFER
jgi:hypothetical protein